MSKFLHTTAKRVVNYLQNLQILGCNVLKRKVYLCFQNLKTFSSNVDISFYTWVKNFICIELSERKEHAWFISRFEWEKIMEEAHVHAVISKLKKKLNQDRKNSCGLEQPSTMGIVSEIIAR